MSEYQYYEFRAIDRPLRPAEMARLRERSSRATITARRFQNEYDWGDFRGDPAAWMDNISTRFCMLPTGAHASWRFACRGRASIS